MGKWIPDGMYACEEAEPDVSFIAFLTKENAEIACAAHNADIERLEAENAELRAKIEDIRSGIGCARGQRTTQFCAEAAALRAKLDAAKSRILGLVVDRDKWQKRAEERAEALTDKSVHERDELRAKLDKMMDAFNEVSCTPACNGECSRCTAEREIRAIVETPSNG